MINRSAARAGEGMASGWRPTEIRRSFGRAVPENGVRRPSTDAAPASAAPLPHRSAAPGLRRPAQRLAAGPSRG